jgi:hypothetical protein
MQREREGATPEDDVEEMRPRKESKENEIIVARLAAQLAAKQREILMLTKEMQEQEGRDVHEVTCPSSLRIAPLLKQAAKAEEQRERQLLHKSYNTALERRKTDDVQTRRQKKQEQQDKRESMAEFRRAQKLINAGFLRVNVEKEAAKTRMEVCNIAVIFDCNYLLLCVFQMAPREKRRHYGEVRNLALFYICIKLSYFCGV